MAGARCAVSSRSTARHGGFQRPREAIGWPRTARASSRPAIPARSASQTARWCSNVRIGGVSAPPFAEIRSRPVSVAPLLVQTEGSLPSLLHRELLGPRTHERRGARVASVALERIALEEAPSAAD